MNVKLTNLMENIYDDGNKKYDWHFVPPSLVKGK
jgi:hypothetical protein